MLIQDVNCFPRSRHTTYNKFAAFHLRGTQHTINWLFSSISFLCVLGATTEADPTPGPSSGATESPPSAATPSPIATPSPTLLPTATPAPLAATVSPVATPVPSSALTLSPVHTLAPPAAPPSTSALSPAFTQTPSPAVVQATPSGSTSTSNSTTIVVGVASAVAAAALIAIGLCFKKRDMAKKKNKSGRRTPLPVVVVNGDNEPQSPQHHPSPPSAMYPHTVVAAAGDDTTSGRGRGVVSPPRAALAEEVPGNTERTPHAVNDGRDDGGGGVAPTKQDADYSAEKPSFADTTSTMNSSTGGPDEIFQADREAGVPAALFVFDEPKASLGGSDAFSSTGRRGSSGGLGPGHAVAEAARDLALNCHIPGVAEVAAAVSILANLVTDNRDNANKCTAASLKRCRSIVMLLQRAARVLGKVS